MSEKGFKFREMKGISAGDCTSVYGSDDPCTGEAWKLAKLCNIAIKQPLIKSEEKSN